MWEYLLKFIVMQLLAELLRPKPKFDRPAAAGLKDLGLPTVDETRPLPWLIGRAKVDAPSLFATYDFRTVGRSKRERTGYITHTNVPIGYDYYIGAGMHLCAGSGVRLREIWAGSGDDAVMIWSGLVNNGGQVFLNYQKTAQGQEDYPQGFRGYVYFHSGSTTPDAYLVAKAGAGNVPAWPHATYVVLRGSSTTTDGGMWVGTTGQVLPLSFVVERIPTDASVGLGAIPGDITKSDANGDMNPALAVAELITDPVFGAGEHPSFVDAASFWAAARTLQAENHFIGTLIDQSRSVADVVFEFCRQVGALLQPDPTTGNRMLKLLRSGDAPVLTLDDSNIATLATFSRASLDEATSAVTINYLDRAAKYKQRPVTVRDRAAIEAAGQVVASTQQYSSVTSAALAQVLAMRDLRTLSAPLATARLTAIVPKRQRLLPGDMVALSSVKNGISSVYMRVTSARFSQPGDASCELELVEDVFTTGLSVFAEPVAATPPTLSTVPGPIASILFNWPNAIIAPKDLSGALPGNQHLMFFAGADAANAASGYRLGFSDSAAPTIDNVAWSERPIGFAAKGRVTSAPVLPLVAGRSFNIVLSASDAATVTRNGTAEVLLMHDAHTAGPAGRGWHKGTVSMTGSTTAVVTLTGINTYASDPNAIVVTDDIWMLYDYVIDTAPLPVTVYNNTGNPSTSQFQTSQASNCRAQTVGAGGYGSFTYTLTSPSSGSSVTGVYSMPTGTILPTWNTY